MNEHEADWIFALKKNTTMFLDQMKSEKKPGFFRYSLSGDLFDESTHWGLGNTVYATKCIYTLGLNKTLSHENKSAMINFIKSFQVSDGRIYDPFIRRRSFVREKLSAVKHRCFDTFFHTKTMRAETRQAISALKLLDAKPDLYPKIPKSIQQVENYLAKQNWKIPWGAGSHFSHLLFFLEHSDLPNRDELIEYAIDWVNRLQDTKSGSWFLGQPTIQMKINGAMKILTGLKVTSRMEFSHPEKLIDLALSSTSDRHACDNFNVIFVLKYASQALGNTYRTDAIKQFALKRLAAYREFYWPEHGGFSFDKGRAERNYYRAVITKRLPEPDIHGTMMFLWGIALIAQILEIDKQLGFQECVA